MQAQPAWQTGNMKPDIPPRDAVRVDLDPQDTGPPQGPTPARRDVLVVIGNTGQRLPPIRLNRHWNGAEYAPLNRTPDKPPTRAYWTRLDPL